MKRAFLAIALLAVSWLPGIGYFHHPDWMAQAALIAGAVLLLSGIGGWELDRKQALAGAILCAIATIWMPLAYRAMPLLLACGLAMHILPIPTRWPRAVATGAISAAMILLGQAIALFVYTHLTARSHELPAPLAWLIVGIARLIGIQAAYDGHSVSLATMRTNYPMAASWELLIDPATLCFLAGGLVWIGWRNWRGVLALSACVLVWIPVRIALLLGLYMHRALRLEFDSTVVLMDQFWSTWLSLLLIAGPALLAARLVPVGALVPALPGTRQSAWLAALLACAGAATLAMCVYWDPIGQRKAGRVIFDEYHSKWEPTDQPFGVDDYGHNAAYTYKVLYEYLSHFYNVSRLQTAIDEQALASCDVLILKVPTKPIEQNEITVIKKFVARGGGLLLVGEHTDVFGTGTYLNHVAKHFGFEFRYDCLFDIDDVFQQKYRPDAVPHPIMQHVAELDYAVSCSIEPEISSDRPADRGVIVSTGLRSLPADYHASNFYPQVEDRADTRYGAFVQLWAARYNEGRVVGYSDSTEFSNFCLFDPGKSELFIGMVEWLNRHSAQNDPRLPLAGIGAIALAAACTLARGRAPGMLLACSAGLFGFSIMIPVLGNVQKRFMPVPAPTRPLTRVVMDRTVCDSTLPLAGFIAGKPDGFGIFERWILRLGYFTARRSGADALQDKLLIFAYPTKPVSREFREQVKEYVNRGGKVLVIDSAENQNSTANSVLAGFDIHLKRDAALSGDLELAKPSSTTQPTTSVSPIQITNALEVGRPEGAAGQVFASVSGKPVCVTVKHGAGSVTVLGFGSRFADANYGYTGDNEPDAAMRQAYQVQFDLIRGIVEEK